MTRRALVLGAGGHAAMAWELGVIAGVADEGVDLRQADVFVGTSAGSYVCAQITSGRTLEQLFDTYLDPVSASADPAPGLDIARWRADLVKVKTDSRHDADFLRRVGAYAATTAATDPAKRRKRVARRLPGETWPESDIRLVAVDADAGERRVFDRSANVPLLDAVAASSAVPGIWPTVQIDGRRYMDGGMYSIDNADLAAGCDRVVIVTLPVRVPPLCVLSLDAAVTLLRERGARVAVVHPDQATQAAFNAVGGNVLDPRVRAPAARAGREQGRAIASSVIAPVWR